MYSCERRLASGGFDGFRSVVTADQTERSVKQDGSILRVSILKGRLHGDALLLETAAPGDEGQDEGYRQPDQLLQRPSGHLIFFLEFCVSGYYNDDQYKEDENDK